MAIIKSAGRSKHLGPLLTSITELNHATCTYISDSVFYLYLISYAMEVTSELYRNVKKTFNERIDSLMKTKKDNSVIMSKLKYYQSVDQLKESKH